VLRLETRVRELEEELNATRRTAATPDSDLRAAALDEVFATFLDISSLEKPDPEKMRMLLARLGQLHAKSTAYFIDRYRKSREGEERTVAMQLALAAGGADAADFIHLLLNDATLDVFTRTELLRELSGDGCGLFSIRRLPISEALGSTAMTLCRSGNTEERAAGAGLLGGLRNAASRAELRRLVAEDTELGVRVTALLSLGHVGDPSTRCYLERLSISPDATRVREAIESALKKLAER
jgi:HEAT repeat protein